MGGGPAIPPGMSPLTPPARAIAQLTDPAFLGVLFHSVFWTLLAFAGVAVALSYLSGYGLTWLGWHEGGWLAPLLGTAGSVFLAHLLFLPVAGVVATLFADRIAGAVERRWYPNLPPGRPAPIVAQGWDGLVLGLQILGLQVVALLLTPFVAGLSLPLGWAIAAWAIGRGLAVAILMRRMDRRAALTTYRQLRPAILFQGLLATAASLLPVVNLLVPVLVVASITHVVAAAMSTLPRFHEGLWLPTRA